MKRNNLILAGAIVAIIVPVILLGFVDGPRKYHFQYNSAWLGISTKNLTPQLCEFFGVDEDRGVLISEVVEDSPAQEAGLKAGDVIVEADGEIIRSKKDLVTLINDFDPGDELDILYVRDHDSNTITVVLSKAKYRGYKYFSYGPEKLEIVVPEIDVEVPEFYFEMPEFDKDELKSLREDIKEEMKSRKDEIREQMEELREKMKDIHIEIDDEFSDTI
jgi:membrane-associated protease RseP (regulator of RpoE activity)